MEKRPVPSLLDAVKAARGDLEPSDVPVFLERLAQIKKAMAEDIALLEASVSTPSQMGGN